MCSIFALPDIHLWSPSRDVHDDSKTSLGVPRTIIHRFIRRCSVHPAYRKASKKRKCKFTDNHKNSMTFPAPIFTTFSNSQQHCFINNYTQIGTEMSKLRTLFNFCPYVKHGIHYADFSETQIVGQCLMDVLCTDS
jgi:hypothetical protein